MTNPRSANLLKGGYGATSPFEFRETDPLQRGSSPGSYNHFRLIFTGRFSLLAVKQQEIYHFFCKKTPLLKEQCHITFKVQVQVFGIKSLGFFGLGGWGGVLA